MSSRHRHVGEVERDVRLRDAVLGVLSTATGPVTAAEISTPLAATPEEIDEVLSELADEGEVARLPDPDGTVQWRTETATVQLTHEANSYRAQDSKTGLVTRAGDRPDALRRLADRIEQYERGDSVGAQIEGITDVVLSPEYIDGITELVEGYVEPAEKHLYVYVKDQGVREVDTRTYLDRDHEILGVALTGQYTAAEFDSVAPVSSADVRERTRIRDSHFPIGMFKLVVVHPEYHSNGIGSALATHGMAYLAENPPVVSMLWVRENNANMHLVDQYGATCLAEFENGIPTSETKCPECGFDQTCECSVRLYGWGFE
ncbi:GNAT family N-acetyltransferase [Halorientalis regularis]|uniref:Acetyltransferase (GNAT) family protein n=1 Tax=Halorientalis regularis TaxID=660518 RepID=A0A1G7K2W6_9EURY|nr:GNAT family N-acetyltransferase [Halorientalis regularis]SDF31311.1 Acetyltransferase (GNAT) family protein [Halorientalis regularis]